MKNRPNLKIDLSNISWKSESQTHPIVRKREKGDKKSPIRHRESVSIVVSIVEEELKQMTKKINIDVEQKQKERKKETDSQKK
tara:strand:+ start:648 stop:896 length:249 start_codon:yes stop_codon:yes gene_type:complete